MRERVTSVLEVVSVAAIGAGVCVLFGVAWALIVGGVMGLVASFLVAEK